MSNSFWKQRPALVTGATGLVGGWLVRRLVASGADVVCLVRDWVPQCELVRSGQIEGVKVVRGDIQDHCNCGGKCFNGLQLEAGQFYNVPLILT